jgi:membrane-bound metal-dependent hydrolase YbcI (DUF457 family)
MPSPISHIAAGIIIYRSLPAEQRKKHSGSVLQLPLLALIILAVSLLPDMDAVLGILSGNMGSYHNQASHSLITGLAASLVLSLILRWFLKGRYLFWVGLLLVTYTVHLFLDMLTQGRGIMLLWPFSAQRYQSPVMLFYGLRWSHGLWSISHIWTVVSEVLFWGIIFGLARHFRLFTKVGTKPSHDRSD